MLCWHEKLIYCIGKFGHTSAVPGRVLIQRIGQLTEHFILYPLQMALQPGVGLGLRYNMPPGLSVPCSVSPFVYTHLSQVHGHVIQPSLSWSSSSSCCIQLSVQRLFLGGDCGVLHSFYMPKPSYSLAFIINLTMFSFLIMASNSSFCRVFHNSFSFTGPYIFLKIFLSNFYFICNGVRPASWSSGQSLWLLIMRSRVRFPSG